ncbi:iron uptake transporter deferrochelatase/peroxidase subunit [Nocardioides sp.]|uniref:iron uptake transporter deferrochelatase/peroxidase subunit n=1 Tax=Nocardioides sp. TaxID=35761 RepID=UPI00261F92B0|nr:iron uptake transporter deferrochelatase/peroxidase subunit [Nocardioides sp.]
MTLEGESAEVVGQGVSRRRLVAGTGVGVVAGAAAGFALGHATAAESTPAHGGDAIDLGRSYDFYTGSHQVGIETAPQRHTVFMTFDLVDGTTTQDLQVLLARWSAAISQLMAGRSVGSVEPTRADGVPQDTGEAYDLAPASLTVTLGLGSEFFAERFGLADKKPKLLADLPALPSDQLRPELTGGALSLQACSDDPQVAYHAIRDLARMARGTTTTRWTVLGFGRASAGKGQTTPRNLMGYKDGTRNVSTPQDYTDHVWIGAEDGEVDWMVGGSYQVVRKIRMDIEIWDSATVTVQHRTFGRNKVEGAPLTGTKEFDTPNFTETKDGKKVIDPASHIALASHENNNGTKILRRGYNFTDGINDLGQLDAGLLFLSYQKNPDQFVQLQKRLGSSDLLNEYIAHIGSGLFAVPPAPQRGHYIGESLFA